jgi:hypothetical protein
MAENKCEKKQEIPPKAPGHEATSARRIFLLFAGLLIIGVAGYFIFRELWLRYVFAHLAGLAIMGFLGCWAGIIARSKGYGFWRAFLLGFVPPIILGVGAVLIVHSSGGHGCGGIVSLAAAFLVIIGCYCAKRKKPGN